MFYKFNQLTQNLVSTTQDGAVGRTVSPQACAASPAPAIQYEYKPLQALGGTSAASRHASSSASLEMGHEKYPVPTSPRYKKLMDLQTKFSAHDGKLVWQKLPMDRPFYFLTFGLAIVGLGMSAMGLYKLVSPPKNQ